MTAARSITLLHISDTQFGAVHRFGAEGLTPEDRRHDSLARRLLGDLDFLRERYGLEPDLVVASGDLANSGRRQEFDEVHDFLAETAEALRLGRERVVMVPGNHDINRVKCRTYIENCDEDGVAATMPYWPKYGPYADMFARFYENVPGVAFPPDEPWTVYEIEELGTVVVGLNSTIAESHRDEDHYGYCGEHQMASVAERLRSRRRDRWLRIGVVHHNLVITSGDDGACLRDGDAFENLVSPHLNVLMHGHTHQGRICGAGPDGLPVLCAGSAAVRRDARPDDVPNQYQVVEVTPAGLTVYARRYNPYRRRFEGDNSVGRAPDESTWRLDRVFADVARAFEAGDDAGDGDTLRERVAVDTTSVDGESDDLSVVVAEACEIRDRGARVDRAEVGMPPLRYLRVTSPGSPRTTQYPVGVVDGAPTAEIVERFRDAVDRGFRERDPRLVSYLVHDGEPADGNLRRQAARAGIRLERLAEFQGLDSLAPYARRQAERLGGDLVYPSFLYVPQRFERVCPGHGGTVVEDDLLGRLRNWLTCPEGRFVIVLGDFGLGKTFLLRQLTRAVHEDAGRSVVPVLVQMRDLERAHSLDHLLAGHLTDAGEEVVDLRRLRYLIEQGRVVLLLDGFDELALRVTYDRAAEHLEAIAGSVGGRAKIVLTSRTQHFISDAQVETVVGARTAALPGRRLVRLLGFTDGQVLDLLTRLADGDIAAARARLELIQSVAGLGDLARNPRMLGFLVALDENRLVRVRDEAADAAALYRELLDQWFEVEQRRSEHAGSPPALSIAERWRVVRALARLLWNSGAETLEPGDLDDVAEAELTDLAERRLAPKQATHMIGSGTLLVRTDDGRFGFAHRSVLEWLVAEGAATAIRRDGRAADLEVRPISPLMADFVIGLADAKHARAWSDRVLAGSGGESGEVAKRNALLVQRRLKEPSEAPGSPVDLAGLGLRGGDLTGEDRRGANLRGADLTEARLDGADLAGADLRDAVLVRCAGRGVDFTGADLRGADLTGATILDSEFRDARLTGTTLTRVALLGADADLTGARPGFGAALPGMPVSPVQISPARSTGFVAVTWHPHADIVATSDTETVALWDAATGEALRTLPAQGGRVWAVCFSPDGRLLATTGTGKEVVLWDAETGERVRTYTGHGDTVWSVCFSPDGRLVAAADNERAMLWDVASGVRVRTVTGHGDAIWSVCFSHDGARVALAGGDVLTLWDTDSGRRQSALTGNHQRTRLVCFSPDGQYLAAAGGDTTLVWNLNDGGHGTLTGHGEAVWSAAFSPDGRSLATATEDGRVVVWDIARTQPKDTLDGHAGRVWSVCFSPDGGRLASAGDDSQVIIWDRAAGQRTRSLTGRTSRVRAVGFDPAGDRLVSAGDGGQLVLWETATGRQLTRMPGHSGTVWSAAFSPDGGFLATGGGGQAMVWNARTGARVHALDQAGRVRAVCFDAGGRLATGGDNGRAVVWDVQTGRMLHSLGHLGTVWSVRFSPDGSRLAVGDDNQVTLWSLDAVPGPVPVVASDRVRAVCFSSDGALLATGGDSGHAVIWDAATGRRVQTFGPAGRIRSVCLTPDDTRLIVGGDRGRVTVWDRGTGRPLRVLAHTGTVWSIHLSPDGRLLAVGDDRHTCLWDLGRGSQLARLVAFDDAWAVLSADGFGYKYCGASNGDLWWSVGLRSFPPGVLDRYYPRRFRHCPPELPLAEFAAADGTNPGEESAPTAS